MAVSELVNLSALLDDAKCFDLVRQHRWPQGVRCPDCDSAAVIRNGHDETQPHRQRYLCKACHGRFDDLTDTVIARQLGWPVVLPHPGMLPDGPGIASSECSRRGVTLSIGGPFGIRVLRPEGSVTWGHLTIIHRGEP